MKIEIAHFRITSNTPRYGVIVKENKKTSWKYLMLGYKSKNLRDHLLHSYDEPAHDYVNIISSPDPEFVEDYYKRIRKLYQDEKEKQIFKISILISTIFLIASIGMIIFCTYQQEILSMIINMMNGMISVTILIVSIIKLMKKSKTPTNNSKMKKKYKNTKREKF